MGQIQSASGSRTAGERSCGTKRVDRPFGAHLSDEGHGSIDGVLHRPANRLARILVLVLVVLALLVGLAVSLLVLSE